MEKRLRSEEIARMGNSGIDAVITWVDGNDPVWLSEKEKYLPKRDTYKSGTSNMRFRDWENLQYIFRGIELYMPWIDTVHFITCGHLPEWLNTEAEKLHIVKHSDFIPEAYLPTFNSDAIELNMHRIPGLSGTENPVPELLPHLNLFVGKYRFLLFCRLCVESCDGTSSESAYQRAAGTG